MKKNLPLSYIEISKKNLIHNIKQFRDLVKKPARPHDSSGAGGGTKISVVIKGNAYGHGQNIVAKILEPYVDYFFVNSAEELKLLRKVSQKPVLLLGYVEKSDLTQVIKLNCVLAVYSLEQIKHISTMAEICKVVQEIHISIDAYLGREGFLNSELPAVLEEIKKLKNIKFSGIYAHFANIEDTTSFTHAQRQINEYNRALVITSKFGFKNLQTHISSTSGILVYEKGKGIHPIVRLGISIYGMWPSEHLRLLYKNKMKLKPVMSWKTKIAQIKTLPKGSTVGYGLTYKTKRKTKIALVPQGYSDGFDRGLSNKGEVLIKDTRCKVIGRISMNMFTVDVTHLKKVKIEDEVVLLGQQGKEKITAEEIGKKLNTINYEVTTRVSSLLPRIVK